MARTTNTNGPNREWLLKAGEAEDSCRSLSVGGLASDLGLLPSVPARIQPAFSRLVEYARRSQGLTIEQLAERADVDLAAIVEIETEDTTAPDVRTVYQLAQVLELTPST